MLNERDCRLGGLPAQWCSPIAPRVMWRSAIRWGWHRVAGFTMFVAIGAAAMPLPLLAQETGVDIGQRRGSFTAGELALLPPVCNAMQGMPDYTGPGGARWRGWLGKDLQHVHHYCRGLRDVIFATFDARITSQQRKFLWERAIDEYGYMIQNCAPTMPLLPEIFFKRGEALLKLNRLAEAESSFKQSWKLKADYWPAYAAWADKLVELKQIERARETLEIGIERAPQAQQLRDRLQLLPRTVSK